MAAYNQNFVFNGLGTQSFIVPTAGPGFVEGKSELPTLVGGGGASSLVVTVNQNGSAIYTGNAGALGFYTTYSGAVGDTIAVVYTSSASADSAYNAIKSKIEIGGGE